MAEQDGNQKPVRKSLERLLQERRELERQLKDEHTQLVAILFTDIVGSTAYFERYGDIEGMAMVQRHNEILFPIVKANKGRIVKTIGDAIMAVFENPIDSVRCGMAMQKKLHDDRNQSDEHPIRIRIGAHAGRVIVQEPDDTRPFDVFGDAVNTAARVEGKADGDELLVSEALAELIPATENVECVPVGALELKGKGDPMPLVSVLWGPQAPRRSKERTATARPTQPARDIEIFRLEMTLGPKGLKVAALDGAGDKGTVKTYSEVPLDLDALNDLAKRFDTYLRGGAGSYLERIQELGTEVYGKVLDERTRRMLAQTPLEHVRLQIDDELAHVPWELMYDGKAFLGLRFAMGRLVAARAERKAGAYAENGVGGHALIVSNASGDLQHAAEEGTAVAGLLADGFTGEVRHIEGPCTKAAFLQALNGCRLLHFAGHAVSPTPKHRGGFQLSDGMASPDEVARAVGTHAPALVFANTCYASTEQAWSEAARGVTDLASALLLQGVRHYLGPMGDIPDEDALRFALRFYEQVLSGASFAEGVRDARYALWKKASEPISFARYVLYGDPRTRLAAEETALSRGQTRSTPHGIEPADVEPWDEESGSTRVGSVTTVREPVTDHRPHRQVRTTSAPEGSGLSKILIGAGVGIILIGVVALGWKFVFNNTSTVNGTPPPTANATPVAALPRTGPIRISVLPFKNVGKDVSLEYLSGGLAETVTTDFGSYPDLQLVERFQLENKELDRAGLVQLDILGEIEFAQGKYVDKKTAAALGKIRGTEVLLVGAFQKAGPKLRATGRFVDVETGEILYTFKVEKNASQPFELQDDVAVESRKSVETLRTKLRPE